jgi:hypothetical protein
MEVQEAVDLEELQVQLVEMELVVKEIMEETVAQEADGI